MKTTIAVLIALTAGLSVLQAQSVATSPKASTPRAAKASPPLLVATLDANNDGIIDAGEIGNASKALKSLDKNADGRLSKEELRRGRLTRSSDAAASPKPMKKQKRASAEMPETERR